MTTYTTTQNGHEIEVSCWKGTGLNYSIHIDGQSFDSGTSDDDWGRSDEASEAQLQAHLVIDAMEDGAIAEIDGGWQYVEVPSEV